MQMLVLGGGSAGWITALYVQRRFPQADITVVESAEIGILGAGEGVTPHFIGMFLDEIGVPLSDLVANSATTLKHGIRFTNWNGDGTAYFHPFSDDVTPELELGLFHPDVDPVSERHSFSAYALSRGRVLFEPDPENPPRFERNPISSLKAHATFALHFDASSLAALLERVGRARGIRVVEGKVVGFHQIEGGNIDLVRLASGETLPCDFLFDCSGFHRVVIGKVYKTPWIGVQDVLPVDRAMPFVLPPDHPLPAYTEAIAMKAGWMWKIPLQNRYGCGYVYDSRFCDEDQARAEVREMWGPEVELPRVIPFKAGYFQDVWVGNCVAVGLSSGFLEPLEATSIWTSIMCLRELLDVYLPISDERAHRDFNRYHRLFYERTVDFLYFHYLTQRKDTPFWANFREHTRTPETVANLLGDGGLRWLFSNPPELAGHPAPFPVRAYAHVAAGCRTFDRESLRRYWRAWGLYDGYEGRVAELEHKMAAATAACIDHAAFLDRLKAPTARTALGGSAG
jgi:tryptophan halogenase